MYARVRRLCSGIQRVWTRHTDDFTSLWKWVIPFPTRRRPRRQECGIYRWSDRWNGVSRWRGTQKCGVISVISSRCTRGWFYGAICVRKPFWEAALAEETRGPFIPSNLSSVRTTINVRPVMGQPVKIVRRTVTYRCAIPPINLHNFQSLDFVGLLALQLIQYRGLYRSLVYVINSVEYFVKILLSKRYRRKHCTLDTNLVILRAFCVISRFSISYKRVQNSVYSW